MRRGDADAGRIPHRVEQIGRELAQIGIETRDRGGGHAQARIGKAQDRPDRHDGASAQATFFSAAP